MGRRKKTKTLKYFIIIVLLFLVGILCYKIYIDKINPNTKKDNKNNIIDNKEKKDKKTKDVNNNFKNDIDTKKDVTNPNNVTNKSSSDEKKENQNEQSRRGGSIKMELLGEENVTVSLGDKYKDAGVKAIYSDGSDASGEVEIDNAVDTSKTGTYTVTYSSGNVVIIRRVTVE